MEGWYLQDRCCRYAMGEQVIQFRSDNHDASRCAFVDHVLCNDINQSFPIWRRYGRFVSHVVATVSQHWSMDVFELCIRTHFCAWTASNINSALLRLRMLSRAMRCSSTSLLL